MNIIERDRAGEKYFRPGCSWLKPKLGLFCYKSPQLKFTCLLDVSRVCKQLSTKRGIKTWTLSLGSSLLPPFLYLSIILSNYTKSVLD